MRQTLVAVALAVLALIVPAVPVFALTRYSPDPATLIWTRTTGTGTMADNGGGSYSMSSTSTSQTDFLSQSFSHPGGPLWWAVNVTGLVNNDFIYLNLKESTGTNWIGCNTLTSVGYKRCGETVPAGNYQLYFRIRGSGAYLNFDSLGAYDSDPGSSPPNPPAVPASPTLVVDSSSQITVSWSAVSGATSYEVRRGDVGLIASPTGTSYVNTGLTGSTTYAYTVAACNANGCSAQSVASTATTQQALDQYVVTMSVAKPIRSLWQVVRGRATYVPTLVITRGGVGIPGNAYSPGMFSVVTATPASTHACSVGCAVSGTGEIEAQNVDGPLTFAVMDDALDGFTKFVTVPISTLGTSVSFSWSIPAGDPGNTGDAATTTATGGGAVTDSAAVQAANEQAWTDTSTPSLTTYLGYFTDTISGVRTLFASVLGFLPGEMQALLAFGLAVAVARGVIGR